MIFRRPQPEVSQQDWMELVRFQQLNTLSLAYLTLRIAEDPELATDETRHELRVMVRDLEDRIAAFEEHVV